MSTVYHLSPDVETARDSWRLACSSLNGEAAQMRSQVCKVEARPGPNLKETEILSGLGQ